MDDWLEAIEYKMCLLTSGMARKRRRTVESDTSIQNRKRRQTYDTKKLHFTNPFTMERKVYTLENSIWYAKYVLDSSPDNKKWSKLFRKRFQMPYTALLDLNQQC